MVKHSQKSDEDVHRKISNQYKTLNTLSIEKDRLEAEITSLTIEKDILDTHIRDGESRLRILKQEVKNTKRRNQELQEKFNIHYDRRMQDFVEKSTFDKSESQRIADREVELTERERKVRLAEDKILEMTNGVIRNSDLLQL